VPTNILEGAQFTPEYGAINRFRKVPALTDPNGPGHVPITLTESAAILLYLSEKTGRLGGASAVGRWEILQWLMFQVGTVGPMLGQAHHFRTYSPERIPYAIDRYTNEAATIYGVLDQRLRDSEYLAGDYSIADVCVFPWTVFYKRQGQSKDDFPHFARWFEAVKARPAVRRGIDVGKELRTETLTTEQRQTVFGKKAASGGAPP
jgi:GST-like protein